MSKTTSIAFLALLAGSAAAQTAARPDPADPKAAVPPKPYESAFKGYRPYVDPELARWRDSNQEVGRLGGHMGHVPKSSGAAAGPAGKPAAPGAQHGRDK